MGLRDALKVNKKTFFNPSAWIDMAAIKDQQKVIWDILKGSMTAPTEGRARTFEEVVKEKKLKESDIAEGISTYKALAVVFIILAVAALLYACLLLFKYYSITGMLLSIAVSALFFSQAFKYDFWAFEMRERKLGLTITDWKRQYFGK